MCINTIILHATHIPTKPRVFLHTQFYKLQLIYFEQDALSQDPLFVACGLLLAATEAKINFGMNEDSNCEYNQLV